MRWLTISLLVAISFSCDLHSAIQNAIPLKQYVVDDAKMSVNLPSPPKDAKLNLKESTQEALDKSVSFSSTMDGLVVFCSYAKYRAGSRLNPSKAMDGAIDRVKRSMGSERLDVKREEASRNGAHGFYAYGTSLTAKQNKTIYRHIILVKDNEMWQVVCAGPSDDPVVARTADRVIQSLKVAPGSDRSL